MLKKRFAMIQYVVVVIALTIVLSSCGSQTPPATATPPQVVIVINPDIEDVTAGQTIAISVNASGQDLRFKWLPPRGKLSASDTSAVIYTAPDTAGVDTVAVEVSSTSGTTTKSVSFNIIVPATDTPVPTIVPTNTPLPLPLIEIFPQAVEGTEFTFVSEGGVIIPEFVGDENCIHSGIYGVRFTYDMQGQVSGGWGVHWDNPPVITHFDASEFQTLNFWVRGSAGNEKFQVAMKDTNAHEFWIESRSLLVVPSSWTMVSIPLSKFEGVNTSSLENFTFGFNSTHGSGSICVDGIAFAP